MSIGSGGSFGTGGGGIIGGGGSGSQGTLRLISIASVTSVVELWGYTRDPVTGATTPFSMVHTPNTDRTTATQNVTIRTGSVGSVCVSMRTAGVKRGQCYVSLHEVDADNHLLSRLLCGYVYEGGALTIGDDVESGPGGGEGFRSLVTEGADVAGNVTTTITLAATNAVRKYHGVVTYLNADGNAGSRVPTITFRGPWGATPTGFGTAAASNVFQTTGPTIIATEEGTQWVFGRDGSDGIISGNDNGAAPTYASSATNPQPFPYVALEGDPATLIISITAGLAGDVYSVFTFREEWLVL